MKEELNNCYGFSVGFSTDNMKEGYIFASSRKEAMSKFNEIMDTLNYIGVPMWQRFDGKRTFPEQIIWLIREYNYANEYGSYEDMIDARIELDKLNVFKKKRYFNR